MGKVTGNRRTVGKTSGGNVETVTRDGKSESLVRLYNGEVVSTHSEAYRLNCEANWVFKKYRNKNTRQKYLAEVQDKRGKEARDYLYAEMLRIHLHKKDKHETNTAHDRDD